MKYLHQIKEKVGLGEKSTGPEQSYSSEQSPASVGKDGARLTEISSESATESGSTQGNELFDPKSGVKRGLETKHVSMMALAGIIGAGLIVGTGQALSHGGPAALIIGFGTIGLICAGVMQSIGEMAIYPDGGGFLEHANRFVNRPFGAVISVNYFLCFAMVQASEYSALMSIFSHGPGTWDPHDRMPDYGVFLLFWFAFTAFQSLGVTAFGWSEYWIALVKLLGLLAFFIFAIVYVSGGVKNRPAFGFHYWNDPGAFATGFRGVARVFIFCSTFYAGTEAVGVTATESRNPGRAIPKAVRQVLIRILVIYMGSAIFIGMTCPYNAPQLVNGGSKSLLSPFTVAIQNAGWERGYHLVNAFLLVVLLSGINASVFFSTRTVLYMAHSGNLPKFMAWTDRRGVPFPAMIFSHAFGYLALMNLSEGAASAYNYIVNLSGVCIFVVWGGISLNHLRFRRAWRIQGHTRDELPYKAFLYPWLPLAGLAANIFLALVQSWTAFSPFNAGDFVDGYVMLPVSAVIYVAYAIRDRQFKWKKPEEIDLVSGKREDLDPPKSNAKWRDWI